MKQGKRILCVVLIALVLVVSGAVLWRYFHPARASLGEADLVFVSWSEAEIASVVVNGEGFEQGAQNADNSPVNQGDPLCFEVDSYPVTVTAWDGLGGSGAALASCTVEEAPAEGERWYVTARDSGDGIVLEISNQWPEED